MICMLVSYLWWILWCNWMYISVCIYRIVSESQKLKDGGRKGRKQTCDKWRELKTLSILCTTQGINWWCLIFTPRVVEAAKLFIPRYRIFIKSIYLYEICLTCLDLFLAVMSISRNEPRCAVSTSKLRGAQVHVLFPQCSCSSLLSFL